jgi:transcription termination factor Rho
VILEGTHLFFYREKEHFMKFTHMRRVKLQDLYTKSFDELVNLAAIQQIFVQTNISKWELMIQILRSAYNVGAQLSVEGVLKIQPLGYGMIRSHNVDPEIALPSDVYIAPSKIKFFNLQDGMNIFASIRPPQHEESYFSVKDLLTS